MITNNIATNDFNIIQTINKTNENKEVKAFDDILNTTINNNHKVQKEETEQIKRIPFDLSYENIKGMTNDEIDEYFPYLEEDDIM